MMAQQGKLHDGQKIKQKDPKLNKQKTLKVLEISQTLTIKQMENLKDQKMPDPQAD